MTRRFDLDSQQKFARLSGDFNPIHVDPIAARRLMFGQPIVHGIHTLLWLLDTWLCERPAIRIARIRADFRNSVRLNEEIFFLEKVVGERQVRLEALSKNAQVAVVNLHWQPGEGGTQVSENSPPAESPLEMSGDQIASARGTVGLGFDRSLAAAMLPHASAKLPPYQFGSLLATTRVVGMRVPGLHSLFNSLDLNDSPDISPSMNYAVEDFDDRFARAVIRLEGGGLCGSATAFVRPAPVAQPGCKEVSRLVSPGEFANERALVIGGSRGLGEIAVKQLAAGGAAVKFSYHLGEADARRLEEDVLSHGGQASCFQLDVKGDMSSLAQLCQSFAPTMLCFFSTPSLLGAPRGKFSCELFHELCRVYVDGFMNVFTIVSAGSTLNSAMQPSSQAVEEIPFGMSEYSAAKSAAESLMRGLGAAYPKIRFCAPRWGRMATDLTASIARLDTADPVPVVLAALREMKRA